MRNPMRDEELRQLGQEILSRMREGGVPRSRTQRKAVLREYLPELLQAPLPHLRIALHCDGFAGERIHPACVRAA